VRLERGFSVPPITDRKHNNKLGDKMLSKKTAERKNAIEEKGKIKGFGKETASAKMNSKRALADPLLLKMGLRNLGEGESCGGKGGIEWDDLSKEGGECWAILVRTRMSSTGRTRWRCGQRPKSGVGEGEF